MVAVSIKFLITTKIFDKMERNEREGRSIGEPHRKVYQQ